jgi:hypothetical protein
MSIPGMESLEGVGGVSPPTDIRTRRREEYIFTPGTRERTDTVRLWTTPTLLISGRAVGRFIQRSLGAVAESACAWNNHPNRNQVRREMRKERRRGEKTMY